MPSLSLLAAVQLDNPLTWAIIIGWIMSVVLHEFSHGLVGYLGGDYTIKERGGLTLNPIQYIDPVFSLLLPVLFLIMGGVPLPGGVTYIRRDLLKSRAWDSAVAAAGPAMNFILFILLALPFHPALGWINTNVTADKYETWQKFLGAMALLQIIAVIINLLPVPPLDGFNIIAPYMNPETRIKLSTPPVSTFAFFVLFMILWNSPGAMQAIYRAIDRVLTVLGFDDAAIIMMSRCYNLALFGKA
jgi:Zn-dependent protease